MLTRALEPVPAPFSRALWWDQMRPHLDHHLHSLGDAAPFPKGRERRWALQPVQ